MPAPCRPLSPSAPPGLRIVAALPAERRSARWAAAVAHGGGAYVRERRNAQAAPAELTQTTGGY